MGFFDRRNLAGLQTTAKYAPRRKRGGRRPFLLGQDFCSVKNFPTENCLRQRRFLRRSQQNRFQRRRSSPFLSKNALTILTPKVVLRSKILNEPFPKGICEPAKAKFWTSRSAKRNSQAEHADSENSTWQNGGYNFKNLYGNSRGSTDIDYSHSPWYNLKKIYIFCRKCRVICRILF